MWKDYSKSFIKNNRASSISVMAAALIATLFLSLLCSLFYNFWIYEIERVIAEEGDWQGRITGNIDKIDLIRIRNFGNVKKAVINEELSGEEKNVVDVYFENTRTIFEDMPLIIKQLGLEEDAAGYHLLLLSRYLIHDPQDEEPPLLLTFFLVILIMVSLSLILIIRNSFAISMNARIHQFGIFSSIGAAPKQIRICLIQEVAALCTVPVLLGGLFGIAISYVILEAANMVGGDVMGRAEAVFQYHPLVFVITLLAAALTVLLSAWLPAGKLSRMTPLEAIRNTGGSRIKRKSHSVILSGLFGIEGELAQTALKAQKKAMLTSTVSLILSFLGFTTMLCFFTLSEISTRLTYFERYQDAWDVMVTVKNTRLEDFDLDLKLRQLQGVCSSIVYQKGMEAVPVFSEQQSSELFALGGLEAVAGILPSEETGYFQVKAPVVIMDDAGFTGYCKEMGVTPDLDGAIILNRIWDSVNTDFRNRKYIPFIREGQKTMTLGSALWDGKTVEIPVLDFVQEPPVLREEYDNYALVHFIPLSSWNRISGQIDGIEQDIYIRILAEKGTSLEDLNALEKQVVQLIGQQYEVEIENRIQERLSNDELIKGSMVIFGAFCSLLALIGIANVFSNTLGFLRQRKREFAQYMSVGMTPAGMRKMFCVEALVIAGRPLLITLPLTVLFVAFIVNASHLKPEVFLAEVPIVPIAIFILAIMGFVALAYYIGGKRILRCDLSEALRNDTVV